MAVERTLILIKPDGIERGLIGETLGRFERAGMRVIAMKTLQFDEALARRHYADHLDRYYFPNLLKFILSGPSIALVLEGDDAIQTTRALMGPTEYGTAQPGTIRGDYAVDSTRNIVHGSDSVDHAKHEIGIFFDDADIFG